MLKHVCDQRCLKRVNHTGSKSDFVCRKTNNLLASPDHKRDCLIDLGNEHLPEVINTLVDIGMCKEIEVNMYGYKKPFECSHCYFHPKKHILGTTRTDDKNISPVEGKTFAACRSMQNIQSLICNNGCNKYVNKYSEK